MRAHTSFRWIAVGITSALALGSCAFLERASAPVSGDTDAASGNNGVALSADGRYVTFTSQASNLVSGVTGKHVYVRDVATDTIEVVDVSSDGDLADGPSSEPSISADGRYVAFDSDATNLVADDSGDYTDVFVRDRQAGTTSRVSVNDQGDEGDYDSYDPSISHDGSRVAFVSGAENFTDLDTNGVDDIYVRDRTASTTIRASVKNNGDEGDDDEEHYDPVISGDGNAVVWVTYEPLASDDDNEEEDVYIRTLDDHRTKLASRNNGGSVYVDGGYGIPGVNADGRYVAFQRLVLKNGKYTVVISIRDLVDRTTSSMTKPDGTFPDSHSFSPVLSDDGQHVGYISRATDLVPDDDNGVADYFVTDVATGRTVRTSTDLLLGQNPLVTQLGTMSADAEYVAFTTDAGLTSTNGDDANGMRDVYVRSTHTAEIATIFPSTIARGDSVEVTITGSGFQPDAQPSVGDVGITVSDVTVFGDSAITATMTAAADAPVMPRPVRVFNPGAAWGPDKGALAVCEDCLTVE